MGSSTQAAWDTGSILFDDGVPSINGFIVKRAIMLDQGGDWKGSNEGVWGLGFRGHDCWSVWWVGLATRELDWQQRVGLATGGWTGNQCVGLATGEGGWTGSRLVGLATVVVGLATL